MKVSLFQLCIALAAVCFAFGEEAAETQQRTRWDDHTHVHVHENTITSYVSSLLGDSLLCAVCRLRFSFPSSPSIVTVREWSTAVSLGLSTLR